MVFYPSIVTYCFVLSVLNIFFKFSTAAKFPNIDLNDGNKMPIIAFGTGRNTAQGTDLNEVREAVVWAIEAGYRQIDASAFAQNEQQVGQGIADAIAKGLVQREDLFVTTKLHKVKPTRDRVVSALRESLTKLGLDYVDLYLIHPFSVKTDNPDDDIDYLETWEGMEEAKHLGLTKSIGVTNFNIMELDRLIANSKIKPAVNQIEVNPTLTQVPLVAHSKSLGLAVMAYSPFGFLVPRKQRPVAPPPRFDDPTLVEIANKYGKTTAQIVLRYLIERGLVPIPKSTNKQRIAQNIDLFDFQLNQEEIDDISKFNKNVHVIDLKY